MKLRVWRLSTWSRLTLGWKLKSKSASVFTVGSGAARMATVLTSNKGFEEWGEVFGDDVMAGALIDRLVHHCHIVNIGAIATASGPTASCSRSSGPHPHPPPRPSAGLAARRPGRPRLVPPRRVCHFPRRFCAIPNRRCQPAATVSSGCQGPIIRLQRQIGDTCGARARRRRWRRAGRRMRSTVHRPQRLHQGPMRSPSARRSSPAPAIRDHERQGKRKRQPTAGSLHRIRRRSSCR